VRILIWHVHGSWTTSFVQGDHSYLVPVTPDRGPDGRGRARTWRWPARVSEVAYDRLGDAEIDVVVLQRPRDLELAQRWLGGRRPGRDIPAIYVEHDTPRGAVPHTRHPLADRDDLLLVHVTHFNDLMWDSGRCPGRVIEHGVVDPGDRYTGSEPRAAVVINDPVRRGRLAGTDLLDPLSAAAPIDLFGMRVTALPAAPRVRAYEDLPQERMHGALARRRVYVHTFRWTSLGLSLIEAMMLGLPVVALAANEAVEAVPPEAGVVSTRVEVLADAVRGFVADPLWARRTGKAARAAATARYGLTRFLRDWDRALTDVTR
jgi:hypothetical protein